MTVGFIGRGDQGAPMARAIADKGFDLYVWARRPDSYRALDGSPHTVADSPADLAAHADIERHRGDNPPATHAELEHQHGKESRDNPSSAAATRRKPVGLRPVQARR
ncbi:NAD(P)-binding domain-containing protein [Micromonospora sp. NPDC049101]|uniref:NAD(P)-binding domain-containing protein n=1 Tax=Micromonospora sp. NPDC049101 TaxID=3155032 RepID=UPI0033D2EFD9